MITHHDIKDISYLKPVNNRNVYYDKQKDVFWPFYLWRVIAPKEKSPLNIFQLLILKLVKAGCDNHDKLFIYTNLDRELIKYILSQLTNDGYLNGWKLTETGLSLLKGAEIESSNNSCYYLIQDAQTGQLLPRVLSDLPYIESMDFSNEHPEFIASRNSGKSIKPFLLRASKKVAQPSAEQMSDCLRNHRRELNQLRQANIYVSDESLKLNTSIELIEDKPIPVYIHLKLFSTFTGDRNWYLSDPSGLTHTVPELNEIAEKVIESNKHFASRVNDVLGIAENEYVSSHRQQTNMFEEQAKLQLLSKYPWTQKNEILEKYVLAMLRFKLEVEYYESPRSEILDGLLNESQKVIEAWIKAFLKPDKSDASWHVLVKKWNGSKPDFQQNKKFKEDIYIRVEGVSQYSAWKLSTVPGTSIKSALTFGNQSLKPLLAGMLLRCPYDVELLNNQLPNWLDSLIELAEDRNKVSGHAGSLNIAKNEAMVHVESVEHLLAVLEHLLGNRNG